jgi:hypothetical protein
MIPEKGRKEHPKQKMSLRLLLPGAVGDSGTNHEEINELKFI